jgi:hypothetical protein
MGEKEPQKRRDAVREMAFQQAVLVPALGLLS